MISTEQRDMTATIDFPSPLGRISLTAAGATITGCAFLRHDWRPAQLTRGGQSPVVPPDVLRRAAKQILDFLDGDRSAFDVTVRLTGTAFQHAVWRTLASIPFGETMTYGEIAEAVGVPHAGRAVGAAVAANPVPLLVPCHRVLGSRRSPVGYDRGEGLSTKMWLLRHEGIPFSGSGPSSAQTPLTAR